MSHVFLGKTVTVVPRGICSLGSSENFSILKCLFMVLGTRGSWCCKPLCSEPCRGLPEQVLHARGAAGLRDRELKAAAAGQHIAPPDPSRIAATSRCLFLSWLLQLCSRPAISQAGCLEEMRVLQGCQLFKTMEIGVIFPF